MLTVQRDTRVAFNGLLVLTLHASVSDIATSNVSLATVALTVFETAHASHRSLQTPIFSCCIEKIYTLTKLRIRFKITLMMVVDRALFIYWLVSISRPSPAQPTRPSYSHGAAYGDVSFNKNGNQQT